MSRALYLLQWRCIAKCVNETYSKYRSPRRRWLRLTSLSFPPDDTDKFHAVSDQLHAVTRTRPFDPQLAHTWGATLFRRLRALPVFPPSRAAKALRRERARGKERASARSESVGRWFLEAPTIRAEFIFCRSSTQIRNPFVLTTAFNVFPLSIFQLRLRTFHLSFLVISCLALQRRREGRLGGAKPLSLCPFVPCSPVAWAKGKPCKLKVIPSSLAKEDT